MHEPTIAYRQTPSYEIARRAFDITIASIALAVSSPVLLVAAAAIVIEDGFPLFFVQTRIGRFGRPFKMIKLRSMYKADCGSSYKPVGSHDPRITRAGRILRKLSIDELPQFINVWRGEMSVVGPRPEMPFIVRNYLPWQHLRLLAKPGITGLWQTSVRSRVPLHKPEATHIDLEYIRTASTTTDGRIVFKTFRVLVSTQGAY